MQKNPIKRRDYFSLDKRQIFYQAGELLATAYQAGIFAECLTG